MDVDEEETERLEWLGGLGSDQPPAKASARPVVETPDRGPWIQYRVPRGFEWNRYTLPIAALPPELEGLVVLHITDLHLRAFWSDVYDQFIERVRQEKPDLILITGDFVDNRRRPLPAVPTVQKLVSQLKARFGCFGILGNHDKYHLAPHLQGLGMKLLERESHRIEIKGAALELLALPGVDRRHLTQDVLESYPARRFGVPRLVMAHFPDNLKKISSLKADVFFAGHTHGGQICLPNGFPPVRHDSLPRFLCRGVHRAANTWVVVGRGMGFTGVPFRFFCPAEVIELTLTRG